MSLRVTRILGIGFLIVACGACGDDDIRVSAPGVGGPSGAGASKTKTRPSRAVPDAGTADLRVVASAYIDEQFVENLEQRDPFRSFSKAVPTKVADVAQREVVMSTTAVEQMKLIGIISGLAQPKAMLLDTAGKGHVVERGDYLGRPDVVQTGGTEGIAVTLNWRVDRIRPTEVVLMRDDPTGAGRPPLTRVIPLHNEADLVRSE